MDVKIEPKPLSGEIQAIPSKSDAHRLLICAALSDKPTKLIMPRSSEDIDATISCLSALGAHILRDRDTVVISPIVKTASSPHLNCMESGSTFRFLLPVASALYEHVRFTGRGRLPSRPIGHLMDEMKRHGVRFSSDMLPFEISGALLGGEFILPGNVSSQYITGLLFSLPLVLGGGRIKLTTNLESSPYVDITISALSKFGVSVNRGERSFEVTGGQKFISPGTVNVEGDWSNAAFFLSAGAIGSEITVNGLNMDSPQGDKVITEILKRFGADVKIKDDSVSVSPKALTACEIDVSEAPDLLPILCIVASCAEGETRFINAARLRLKESDRLSACVNMLNALGIEAKAYEDSMTVRGGKLLGGIVDSVKDHRIAMSAAIAAMKCEDSVIIKGAEAVNKSYPAFYEDYKRMGGRVCVI